MRYLLSLFLLAIQPLFGVAIEKKIGQLIVVGFRGYSISDTDWIAQQIAEGQIGGVLLYEYDTESKKFDRNIQSPEQLNELCHSLKKYAPDVPLFICIDQEGGVINHLKPSKGFPSTQSAQALGDKNDLKLTREQGELIGGTLIDLGINLNFSPVVDVNINPISPCVGKKERSFSADPNQVVAHAREIIRGHRKFGVLTTLKHFPGHGSASTDSHDGFVDITKTWSDKELIPFRELIKTGDADMIMTAHVYNKNYDDKLPASLSPAVIKGILRDQLHFNGVVITDDLQMGAIRKYYSLETTVKLALQAGVDVLQFSNQQCYDPQIAPKVIAIIKKLVESGEISIDQINRSYARVQRLKAQI